MAFVNFEEKYNENRKIVLEKYNIQTVNSKKFALKQTVSVALQSLNP